MDAIPVSLQRLLRRQEVREAVAALLDTPCNAVRVVVDGRVVTLRRCEGSEAPHTPQEAK